MREKDIEQYLVKQVKNNGGKAYKWVSPGNDGVPDRIVIFPRTIIFVELKAPGKKADIATIGQTQRTRKSRVQGICHRQQRRR